MSKTADEISSGGLGIHEMRPEDRPRERAVRDGVRTLSDVELLAILIRGGTKNQSAIELAKSLLSTYYGHLDLLYKDFIDNIYPAITGMGKVKLVTIAAAMELGMRATREICDPKYGAEMTQASNSLKIYDYIADRLTGLSEEQMWLLCFNSQNIVVHSDRILSRTELLGDDETRVKRMSRAETDSRAVAEEESRLRDALPLRRVISSGGYQETSADVRVILREALRHRALGIAVVHNHPSGSLTPSSDDDHFTWRLYEACRVVGVTLMDHLIYTDRGYYSYFDHDRLIGV